MNPTQTAPDSRPDGWWREAVVYQVYPRSFSDSDGDGIGDLKGIASRLDHLSELGVDVIWISPFYPSPQVDNGYDISDYRDIDPLFGTLDDFDDLVTEIHRRGMKIVIDIVVNHSSDQHAWFQESRDPDSERRDWYIWRHARPGHEPGAPGAEPDNSGGSFAPSAWQYDHRSGQYYLCMFSPGQPDLNWENPDVRAAVYDMMRWWVDRGVDGFRLDVINFISKPEEITSGGPLDPEGSVVDRIPNGPRLDEFLKEMNREVGLGELNLLTVGEMPGATVDVAERVTDPARDELNMVFTFEHVSLDQESGSKWDLSDAPLSRLKENLAAWQTGLAEDGWNSLYFSNHDQPRQVSRFGDDSEEHRTNSAKTLATVLHLHKGTPYVYQGEEFGMTNFPFTSIDQFADVESLNYHEQATARGKAEDDVIRSLAAKGRDNARTPVQWDDSAHGGFTTGEPWMDVNPNHTDINAAASRDAADSIFQHYRRLIELRHQDAVVRDGVFELLLPDHEQLWAFTRTLGDETLLVLANCSSEAVDLPAEGLPGFGDAELVIGTNDSSDPDRLAAWESRVLRLSHGS